MYGLLHTTLNNCPLSCYLFNTSSPLTPRPIGPPFLLLSSSFPPPFLLLSLQVAASVASSSGDVVITITGADASGVEAVVGAQGFEVLVDTSTPNQQLWKPVPIKGSAGSTVSIGPVPANASAVRYLGYSSPCGLDKFQCPVTTKVGALGSLSGEEGLLPLGPFVMGL